MENPFEFIWGTIEYICVFAVFTYLMFKIIDLTKLSLEELYDEYEKCIANINSKKDTPFYSKMKKKIKFSFLARMVKKSTN